MLSKKLCALVVFLFSAVMFAQEDVLVLTPSNATDPTTFLNAQIVADTTSTGGLLPNRVYELQRDAIYLHDAQYYVESWQTLRIRAQAGEGKKPIIYLYPAAGGDVPPGNMFRLNAGSLEMKDVCIAGFYEPDWEVGVDNVQGNMIRTDAPGSSLTFNGVVFSNINGQFIRIEQDIVKLDIRNTIFANMGALTTSNLGAGKGIDFRASEVDTFISLNNTFVNYQDRPFRHYNINNPDPDTGGTRLLHYARIEHNTFINGMGYHGLMSLGNVGDEVIIKDNLFVDAFALGEDSSDAVRKAEWANTGEFYPTGGNRITWIFTAPNDVTQWTVENNYYVISDSGQAFLDDYGFPPASPLSWHINSKLGADSVTSFQATDLALNEVPALMTNMMRWYETPEADGGAGKSKSTNNFDRTLHDYDRRVIEYYRDTLDAAYPTSAAAYTGGEFGFPVGDLNWFPDKKAEWEDYEPLNIVVDGQKDDFYNALTDPGDGYLQIRYYAWNQNGQPTDDADLRTNVWTAWDNEWFYLYQEVMDDNITNGTTPNVYEVDNLELKFDPIPTPEDTVTNTIWDTRLTAPGMTPGDSLNNITDGNNKQFARHLVDGGYVAELAIRWSAIGTAEKITPAVDNIFGLAINQHDNEGAGRVASVMWASVMDDAVWNTPKYLGTVKFLADNKLEFTAQSSVTPWRVNEIPYDGSDYVRVGVGDDKSLMPKVFSLSQNYPNPFNPSTVIKFDLPKQSAVELAVFNLLGEKVIDLVNEEMPAGYHQRVFDAGSLSSGVYFYRLTAGSFVQTRKLVILK